MGLFKRLFTQEPVGAEAKPGDYCISTGPEHYQGAFKRGAKKRGWKLPAKVGTHLGYRDVVALVPDPGNEYDAKAVQIQLDGLCIGYVPREETARFHRQLKAANAQYLTAEAIFYRGANGKWRARVLA